MSAQAVVPISVHDIVASTMDAIICADDAHRIVLFNRAAERMFGVPADQALGTPLERLLPHRFRAPHRDQMSRFSDTGASIRRPGEPFEVTALRAGGEEFLAEIAISRATHGDTRHLIAVVRELSAARKHTRYLGLLERVIELHAEGADEASILRASTDAVQTQLPGSLASLLLLEGNRLQCAACHQLPAAYNAAIDGIEIGPNVGSCGAAAFRREPVIVADIATDPLWEDFRDLALSHNLRACWSIPILDRSRVLGTLAIYFPAPREPTAFEFDAVRSAAHFVGVTLTRLDGEHALREAHEQLRLLSRRLFDAQENERRDLARELHDRVGQNITTSGFALAKLREAVSGTPADGANALLDELDGVWADTAALVRDVMRDLRPPGLDELGLVPALREFIQRTAKLSELEISLQAEPGIPRAPAEVEVALFRVAQEALLNATRHGRATRATICVSLQPALLCLSVSDDGVGFDPFGRIDVAGPRLGITGMRERMSAIGGTLRIESAPDRGTRIIAELPDPPRRDAH